MNQQNSQVPPSGSVAATALPAESLVDRRQLIPVWIKIFGWIFLVLGALLPLLVLVQVILDKPVTSEIFGLQHYGSPFHPMSLAILAIILSLAVSAYGLLFGKTWGLNACLATGYGGAAICIGTMIYSLVTQGAFTFRLELLVHIFYLRRLHKIKPLWNSSVQPTRGEA